MTKDLSIGDYNTIEMTTPRAARALELYAQQVHLQRIATDTGLSPTYIYTLANRNGVSRGGHHVLENQWTQPELEALKTNYATAEPKELLRLLPNRTWISIRRKAVDLDVDRWNRVYSRTVSLPSISIEDAHWLASAIDFEGCVSLTIVQRKNRPGRYCFISQIELTNTNPNLSQEFLRRARCKRKITRVSRAGTACKDVYHVSITDKAHLSWLIPQIRPFLIAKNEQADLLMEFIKTHTTRVEAQRREHYHSKYAPSERELEILKRFRKLNRRGR